jgi:hypothetical protein
VDLLTSSIRESSEDRVTADDAPQRRVEPALLPRHLCRVMGLNQNYTSRSGTAYHIQVEDRGPVFDDASEAWVRRVNVIAYANYGEDTARIVHGRDCDLPDLRTHEHNHEVTRRIQGLAAEALAILEEKEDRLIARIKKLLQRYYETRDEESKKEFEEANELYPFMFARAFQELRAERARSTAPASSPAGREAPVPGSEPPPPESPVELTEYPLDPVLRDLVLEIERVGAELKRDVAVLKERGAADDILLTTTAKLLARARDGLSGRHGTEFAARHLEMTRNSLVTAYRQIRARLNRTAGTS